MKTFFGIAMAFGALVLVSLHFQPSEKTLQAERRIEIAETLKANAAKAGVTLIACDKLNAFAKAYRSDCYDNSAARVRK